jgi:ATP-dependent helicase/nuclease subunit B
MRLAFPGLMAALAEGEAVVVPTPTLASVAVEQFNRAQLSAGHVSWERPDISSLDAWMIGCWQQARYVVPDAPSLLSLSQERELWRQIIEQDRPDLFDLRAMAAIAQRAARILFEYQIPADGEAWAEHADADRFLRWHREIQHQLKARNWITRADLWRLLPNWIQQGAVNPGPITFAGLTAISPGLKSLSRALGDSVRQIGITPSMQPEIAASRTFESVAHEMEHAARTVRYLLETGHIRSIGILVADFKTHARDLTRVLHEFLYPAHEEDSAQIHISFGSLLTHPLIANALLLLELAQPRIHHASAGAILRSPFLEGAASERSQRALADNKLHRARELDFSLADLVKASLGCPLLHSAFKRTEAVASNLRKTMCLPDWSAAFSDILEAAQWPALETLTERERRAIDQWQTALSHLASLGLVSPPVSLHQALSHLRSLLSRPAAQGDWISPVQILDANSAEGIEFDHTLLLNAYEDAWPAPVSLSPLIPYKLQRLHQVPAANPDSLRDERARKTRSLFTSAACVEVSYTGTISPVLRPYIRGVPEPARGWSGLTAAQSYPPVDLDAQDDSHAPPLIQNGDLRGGSSIIKSQSLCPFKAFAEYRLNARGDDDACFGFDALERGNFVHKALEHVWRRLETQAHLKALSTADLRTLVQDCVALAVRDNGSGPIRTLTTEAERERLVNVVSDWLSVEKTRPQPFRVEYLEEKRSVELSGLKLDLRVDRIDRLKNGSMVLIDYKSGAQSREKLKGERPKEPQLLVYAATVDDPVEGIFFAELKNRGARAVGHGVGKHFSRNTAITDHKHGWDDFLENAAASVHQLAQEFMQGVAAVSPQNGACEYCRIKPICRIRDAALGQDDDE